MRKLFKYVIIFIIIVTALILIITIVSAIKISNSEAYEFTKNEIIKNTKVEERIGKVKSFGLFPSGEVESLNAQIETTVTGEKGEAKIILILEKNNLDDWETKNFYFKAIND